MSSGISWEYRETISSNDLTILRRAHTFNYEILQLSLTLNCCVLQLLALLVSTGEGSPLSLRHLSQPVNLHDFSNHNDICCVSTTYTFVDGHIELSDLVGNG